MKCDPYRDAIALAAGDDLPPGEARRLEEHLASCPACRAEAAELRASRAAFQAAAAPPLDEAVLAPVRRAVLDEIARQQGRRATLLPFPRRVAGRWLAAAAVVLAALGVAWLARRAGTPPSSPPLIAGHETPPATTAEPPPQTTLAEASTAETAAESPGPATGAESSTPENVAGTSPPVILAETPSPRPGAGASPPAPPADSHAPVPAPPATAGAVASAAPSQPMIIKLVSDDPDLVIYWLVGDEDASEETTDA